MPATFSHWSHRRSTRAGSVTRNSTSHSGKRQRDHGGGEQEGGDCGACHDGQIAFGHEKANCGKCHNGDRGYGKEKFSSGFSLPPKSLREPHRLRPGDGGENDRPRPLPQSKTPSGMAYEKTLTLRRSGTRPPSDLSAQEPHGLAGVQQLPPGDLQHPEEDDEAFRDEDEPRGGILRRLPHDRGVPDERLPAVPPRHEGWQ